MEKIQNSSIKPKLIFSFGFLILIFLIFGFLTLYNIQALSDITRTIYNHPLVVSNAALQSNVSITKMHRHMKDIVLFNDPLRIKLSIDAVNREEQQAYQSLDIVKQKILGDEGKTLEKEARSLLDNWKHIREEVIGLVLVGQKEKAAEITIGKGADHVVRLEKKLIGLTDYARKKASSFINESGQIHSKVIAITIIFLVLGTIISSLIAFSTLKQALDAEINIHEKEERLNLVIKGSNDAPWDWDLVSNALHYSPQWWGQLGYTPNELPADSALWKSLIHPEDVGHVEKVFGGALESNNDSYKAEFRLLHKEGHFVPVLSRGFITRDDTGTPLRVTGTNMDLSQRKKAEEQKDRLVLELQKALSEVKTLSGLLPICSHCKKIRDDNGYWNQIEVYIHEHSDAKFSHGICQECIKKYYPDEDI